MRQATAEDRKQADFFNDLEYFIEQQRKDKRGDGKVKPTSLLADARLCDLLL